MLPSDYYEIWVIWSCWVLGTLFRQHSYFYRLKIYCILFSDRWLSTISPILDLIYGLLCCIFLFCDFCMIRGGFWLEFDWIIFCCNYKLRFDLVVWFFRNEIYVFLHFSSTFCSPLFSRFTPLFLIRFLSELCLNIGNDSSIINKSYYLLSLRYNHDFSSNNVIGSTSRKASCALFPQTRKIPRIRFRNPKFRDFWIFGRPKISANTLI